MSRVSDLIKEFCPDGVEFKELQELFFMKNGYTPSTTNKSYWTNGTIPWFRMEDIRENGRILKNSLQKITKEAVKGGKLFPANSIIIATSATIGEHALITVPHLSNQRFTSLSLKPEFYDQLDIKFVFYYCFILDEWCKKNTTTSSFASVDMIGFKKFCFPIPPLNIQHEIVKILDKFTELEAELEAELVARRKQYEYYRDMLLTFDERTDSASKQASNYKIRWMTLGEVATIVRGASPRPIHAFLTKGESGIPWIKIGDVDRNGKYITGTSERITKEGSEKSRCVRPGDFVLSNSMSFGRPYISKIDGCIHDGWLAISGFENSFMPDFLYHLLRSTSIQKEFERRAGEGTVRNLNAEIVRSILVPVPSMGEQERIVSVLDKFDILTNSIAEGLPREIELRRKQYEYYRDKLLSFVPLGKTA